MTEITQLEGKTGFVGEEDVAFGSGEATDTFTVPTSTGATATLTKIPSLKAATTSKVKDFWYVSNNPAITDQAASSGADYAAGNLKSVLDNINAGVVIMPPGNYTISTITIPENVRLVFQVGEYNIKNITFLEPPIFQGAKFTIMSGAEFGFKFKGDAWKKTNVEGGISLDNPNSEHIKCMYIEGRNWVFDKVTIQCVGYGYGLYLDADVDSCPCTHNYINNLRVFGANKGIYYDVDRRLPYGWGTNNHINSGYINMFSTDNQPDRWHVTYKHYENDAGNYTYLANFAKLYLESGDACFAVISDVAGELAVTGDVYNCTAMEDMPYAFHFDGCNPGMMLKMNSLPTLALKLVDTYDTEQSSGTCESGEIYKITATDPDHFFTNCAVDQKFTSDGTETLDTNNKVKKLLYAENTFVSELLNGADDTGIRWRSNNRAYYDYPVFTSASANATFATLEGSSGFRCYMKSKGSPSAGLSWYDNSEKLRYLMRARFLDGAFNYLDFGKTAIAAENFRIYDKIIYVNGMYIWNDANDNLKVSVTKPTVLEDEGFVLSKMTVSEAGGPANVPTERGLLHIDVPNLRIWASVGLDGTATHPDTNWRCLGSKPRAGSGAPSTDANFTGQFYRDNSTTPEEIYFAKSVGNGAGDWIKLN